MYELIRPEGWDIRRHNGKSVQQQFVAVINPCMWFVEGADARF